MDLSAGAMRLTFAAALLASLCGCGGGSGAVGSTSTTPTTPPSIATPTSTGYFASGDAQLHYQLDLPAAGGGPFPAVVFGHGSGQVTKADGAVHVPFWLGQGFAVLRYDKRGAGQSTGSYRGVSIANSEAQIAELAGDMLAGVAFLKARPDIFAGRIGLTGVSQAGWVMVAATSLGSDVRFVVALVGSAMPVGTNIAWENLRTQPIDAAYAELSQYSGSQGWDPLPALRSSRAPVLYLLGAEDRLVPTRLCVPVIDQLRQQRSQVSAHVYAGFGHELGASSSPWPDIANWLGAEGLR